MARLINIFLLIFALNCEAGNTGMREPSFLAAIMRTVAGSSLADGLAIYIPFNGNGVDYGPNHLDGVPFNSPSFTNGMFSRCLGPSVSTNGYYWFPKSSNSLNSPVMTVSLWIKSESVSTKEPGIVAQFGPSGKRWFISDESGTGQIWIGWSSDGSTYDYMLPSFRNQTNWNHLAVVFNTNRVTAYTNGVLMLTSTASTPIVSIIGEDLRTINALYAPKSYEGRTDDLAIWNRALNTNEIALIYNGGTGSTPITPTISSLESNLVSYWKLDEASGIRYDSWGTNHLTDVNTVGSTTGLLNSCTTNIAASSENLKAPWSMTNDEFSVSVWGYSAVEHVTAGSRFVSANGLAGATSNTTFSIGQGAGYKPLFVVITNNANSGAIIVDDNPLRNQWVHYVGVCTATNITLYTNGVFCQEKPLFAKRFTADTTLVLGSYSATIGYYTGKSDECVIWGRALTAAEIQTLYGASSPPPLPFNQRN